MIGNNPLSFLLNKTIEITGFFSYTNKWNMNVQGGENGEAEKTERGGGPASADLRDFLFILLFPDVAAAFSCAAG